MSKPLTIEVNGLIIDKEKTDYIVSKVKANNRYRNIDDEIIKEYLRRFAFDNFRLLKNDFDKIENSRFASECIKYIRGELRKKSALYITKKTRGLLERILESNRIDLVEINKILKSHRSSAERFEIYEELYKKIFSSTDKEAKENIRIADVGCGLNPFSYLFIPEEILKKCIFYAIDIDAEIVEAVEIFFEEYGIKGTAEKRDAIDFAEGIKKSRERFDVVMLFRILEIIDEKGHKKSEKLIKDLDAELYIASFSRKTISGKRMTMQNQPWFEKMIKRIGYEFSTFETENEIFYFCF